MTRDATRRRLIAGAKVALPVAALALLSTLFLVARTVDPEDALPIATVDLSERARDEQLTLPRVMGRTSGGTSYDLAAGAARPDPDDPRRMTVEALRLKLEGAGGATVYAAGGTFDTARRRGTLEGDVAIDTTTGYSLRTDRLDADLDALRLSSPGAVTGEGPLGTLSAGSMVLEEVDGNQRLVFTGGVDLLYRPPTP